MRDNSCADIGHSSDQDQRQNVAVLPTKPNGHWDEVAEIMMMNFRDSGLPVFRGTSALERGTLKSKGGRQLSVDVCGDDETAEVVCR